MPTPRKKSSSPKKPAASAKQPKAASEKAAAGAKSSAGTSKKKAAKKARPAGPPNPDKMSPEVIEFITAVDDYKRKNQRPFPSWSEVLEVVKKLGYKKSA